MRSNLKYRSKRVKHEGFSFASQLEAAVYDYLKLREKCKELKDIQHQDHVYLTEARICYIPDFKFFDCDRNEFVWAEAKGFETDVWKIKKRLWHYYGPGPLEIYKGSAKKMTLVETVIPK
jgi:hypothetical protein